MKCGFCGAQALFKKQFHDGSDTPSWDSVPAFGADLLSDICLVDIIDAPIWGTKFTMTRETS